MPIPHRPVDIVWDTIRYGRDEKLRRAFRTENISYVKVYNK